MTSNADIVIDIFFVFLIIDWNEHAMEAYAAEYIVFGDSVVEWFRALVL